MTGGKRAEVVVDGQSDRAEIGQGEPGGASVGDLANRVKPADEQTAVKPERIRIGDGRGGVEIPKAVEAQSRAAFGEQSLGLELPFQKRDIAVSVAADPVFAPTEGTASVEDVEAVGVEVKAGDAVPVALFAIGMGIGLKVGSGPGADRLGGGDADEEFQLTGGFAVFPGVGGR